MKILIEISEKVVSETGNYNKKNADLGELIALIIKDKLANSTPDYGYYNTGIFFATISETIEPIGYRINVSKSPTLEDGNKKGA